MASDAPTGGFSFDLCKRNAFLESQMGNGAMVSCQRGLESGQRGLCFVSVLCMFGQAQGGRCTVCAGALLAVSVLV